MRQIPPASEPIRKNLAEARFRCGADNGTRTRGLNLGKVALYQLSYVRVCFLGEVSLPKHECLLYTHACSSSSCGVSPVIAYSRLWLKRALRAMNSSYSRGMSEAAKDTGAVLIAAFEGWNDACQAATNVVRHLVKRYESREIRHIKCDDF